LSASYAYRRGDDDTRAVVYVTRYNFALFSNFTFFARDPENGDQIAQTDGRTLAGAHWFYRRTRSLGG
jgi:hypothetical protein